MIRISRLLILLISILPIYTQDVTNVEDNKLVTEKEILLLIQDRQDKSCMIKVLSKYLNEYNIEEEYEFYVKVISIELTKCLFESDFNMPRLNLQYCHAGNWNKGNIGKCIGTFTQNTVIWTTFNGYLNSIDEIYNRHYLKVNNYQILEDYRDIVNKLNGFIEELLEDGDNRVKKMENELDELRNGFQGIIEEIKKNMELERELHLQYYEKRKREEQNLMDQTQSEFTNSFLFLFYRRINVIMLVMVGCVLFSGFMAVFPGMCGSLCGAEVAILERGAAFLFGVVVLKAGVRLMHNVYYSEWSG